MLCKSAGCLPKLHTATEITSGIFFFLISRVDTLMLMGTSRKKQSVEGTFLSSVTVLNDRQEADFLD